jgi:hypothetical protein
MGRRSHSVLSPEFVDSEMDNDDSDNENYSSDSSSGSSESARSSLSLAAVPASVSDVPSSPLKTVDTITDKSFVGGNAGSSKSLHDKAKTNKGKKDKGKDGALFFALMLYICVTDIFGISL